MIYVIAIGAFQALTAVALLGGSKLRSKADLLLILLLCSIAAHLAIKFFIFNFVQDEHVRTQMNTFIGFCYGPLLYLYACRQQNARFIPASRWYVFLPFIGGAIGYLTVICVLWWSAAAGYAVLHFYNEATTWMMMLMGFLFPLLAIRISRRHLQAMPQEKKLINSISYLLISISIISLFFKTAQSVYLLTGQYNIICRDIVYSLLLVICLVIIRYKYVGIMGAMPSKVPATTTADIPAALPARKNLLSTTEHQQIMETLEAHLHKTKIFTDAALNLDKLAQGAAVSKYHISEALNSYAGKSFYQYINEWRIQRATEQIRFMNEKALPVNMLTLAYDCGFKAKSSFNQYFKKITGHTPTEYIKALEEQKAESKKQKAIEAGD
ncbi:helix-turn-helix domain-containing protein [Chitinophaga sp. 22321]|uniref:Helix-turn-helix transcriptional regulator n=1 Tax=Chitinophaga hostae TaxID=2831022 RepID=A0ABS5J7E0_9BACT|nr:helix-turn-helix transcriptional regulator [Chitinophaga hostae]MBS0031134.1 helix-turn-helix transcriptional regulator [Chitinophaga hostae]